MNTKSLMPWLIGVGGAAVAYWYVTHYGPAAGAFAGGPVHNAAGVQIAASYWDTWFPATLPAPAAQSPVPAPAPNPGQSLVINPPVTTSPSASTPVLGITPGAAYFKSAMLTMAGGATLLNADGWAYYFNQLSPTGALTPAEFGVMFPDLDSHRTDTMTVETWLTALGKVRPLQGLSGIVPGYTSASTQFNGGPFTRPSDRVAFGTRDTSGGWGNKTRRPGVSVFPATVGPLASAPADTSGMLAAAAAPSPILVPTPGRLN